MSISLFISRFLYRIRYHLIIGSIVVTALVAYFSQFLPHNYTVKTSIYTGIVSGSSIMDGESSSIQIVNNTFDNLINLVTAQNTLDNVSLRLFAMNMINGNPKEDNEYISAKHYRDLNEKVPPDVKRLIDKSSQEKTVENLKKLRKEKGHNFLYTLLNGDDPHYSYEALQKVQINRIKNSDMVEISYTSDDPGITTNTVKLFNEELLNSYNELRYNSTNDVIAYFENEVAKLKTKLNNSEDVLRDYNVDNNVINYQEQTKAIAGAYSIFEDRYEETMRKYESSMNVLSAMEKQMDTRTKLFLTNKDFIKALDDISTINGKITEIETFTSPDAADTSRDLKKYKQDLRDKEAEISQLSKDMNVYKYSKEGLAIQELANEWLAALIEKTKLEAQLGILEARRKDFEEVYKSFSPVGTELKRREREIAITENSYLEVLHALNLAYLRKKNIQLTTSNLNTISEPTFPYGPNKSKRMLYVIAAFFGSLIFITFYKLIVELLDRTIRDGERAQRLTGVTPIGGFVGRGELRFRGYSKAWNRIAATHIANKIHQYLNPDGPSYINVLSIEPGEGKSFVNKYLIEEWERVGIKVKTIKITQEMSENAQYSLAKDFSFLITPEEAGNYDIILVEYPAFQGNMVPKALIRKASLNLLIMNAKRVWKRSDEDILEHFKNIAGDTPYAVILNNADRYDVEDYTGTLPPEKRHHSMANRLMHMGLTAKKTSIE